MGATFEAFPDMKIGADFTVGTEATNAINVAVQLYERENGNDIGERIALGWYLADDANGDTPSATAPDGGAAIGTDGALIENVANLSGKVISEADGDIDITLTETGVATWYLVLIMPDGKLQVSGAITFA